MNFGPQHPAAHGVLRLVLEMDGETVVKCRSRTSACCIARTEKLAESKPFNQSIGYMDRLDYVSMMCNEHAYVRAIEKLLGIAGAGSRAVHPHHVRRDHAHPEPPDVDRLERARPGRHGGVPVRLPRARGADGLLRGGLRRAHARDLLPSRRRLSRPAVAMPQYNESRWHKGADLKRLNQWREGSMLDFLDAFTDDFPSKVDEYENLLTDNRIWKQRTVDIGVVSPEQALAWGMTGPMLRGSGIEWDLRKKQPYAAYADMDFDIPVGVHGDCYDRYLVRVEEMRQSNRIIKQCVEWLRENAGPVMLNNYKVVPPHREEMKRDMEALIHHFKLFTEGYCVPAGETYAAVEAPKGEFGVYMISDGANKPFRVKVRAPSFVHLSSMDAIVAGHMLPDVVAMIGTYDVVFGEVDR